MKFLKRSIALVTLVGALLAPSVRAADVYSGQMVGATAVVFLTNATKTATSSTPVPIPAGAALVLQPSTYCDNPGTSNTVFSFNISDGTNSYTTTTPITATLANTGTSTNVGWFYIAPTNLYGAKYIRWDGTSTTQTNGTHCSVGYSFVY